MKNSKNDNYRKILDTIEKGEKRTRARSFWIAFSLVSCCALALILFARENRKVFEPDGDVPKSDVLFWNRRDDVGNSSDVCVDFVEVDLSSKFDWFSRIELLGGEVQTGYVTACDSGEIIVPNQYEIRGEDYDRRFVISIGEENRGPVDLWCYGGVFVNDDGKMSTVRGVDVYLEKYTNVVEYQVYSANMYAHDRWIYIRTVGYEEKDFLKVLYSILE